MCVAQNRVALLLWLAVPLALAACDRQASSQPVFIEDHAALMTDVERSSVTAWHQALLAQHDIDYRVLTVPQADDLSGLALGYFEDTDVGGRSRGGRGLLLVIDKENDRVRLEVARELEDSFPDAFVAFVEREQMAPFFAAGRIGDGIVATSELIAGQAARFTGPGHSDSSGIPASTAGGGAERKAGIGEGYRRPEPVAAVSSSLPGNTPLETVSSYLSAMAAQDASADLDLYTAATRAMLGGHVVTRGQMRNLVRTYQDCPAPTARQKDGYAVIVYPGDGGGCSPWFLERGADGRWRLDLLVMQQAIRFDTRNRWRIAEPSALGNYRFAFPDG